MTVTCELIDYEDGENAYKNPRVVLTDCSCDSDMVHIRVGNDHVGYTTVKVLGKELIAAANRCMNTKWPSLA